MNIASYKFCKQASYNIKKTFFPVSRFRRYDRTKTSIFPFRFCLTTFFLFFYFTLKCSMVNGMELTRVDDDGVIML